MASWEIPESNVVYFLKWEIIYKCWINIQEW